jgi:Immunoglobulin domain/Immunoglobulin I-set domain/NHL repeat
MNTYEGHFIGTAYQQCQRVRDSHGITKFSILIAVLLLPVLDLRAQSAPTIFSQPVSQTNLVGATVAFSVAVSGTGPFTYQWRFNGTNLPNNVMATVAGNGSAAHAGDGGAATNASLNGLQGVALDVLGNLFIADTGNNCIRKVDTNGTITTVAGNGSAAYVGDGGAATNASLDNPTSVASDGFGNLFIADLINQQIRKVDTNGIITTVAGNGDVLFAGSISGTYSGDGGFATNAGLNWPSGVAVDASGNLYIADYQNNRIRMVDTNGIINTVAGNGIEGGGGDGGPATAASLYNPYGLALDALHNLFIVDTMANLIRRVDTHGIITTVAGNGSGLNYPTGDGGPATNATLIEPVDVALDAQGNLYIAADYNENSVRKVDRNGIITTVVGSGLNNPFGLAFDALGNLFIADSGDNCVRKVYFSGYPTLTLNAINTTNAGKYTVVITNPYGSVTSTVAVLTVALPPTIQTQPLSQGVLKGSNATLNVIATGTLPLYYDWFFNVTNPVQNGTSASLFINSFDSTNVGQYLVVVSNAFGSVTSSIVNLELPPALTIITQPVSRTNLVGSNAVFSMVVSGIGPFTYQWRFNGTNLPNNFVTTVAGNGSLAYNGDGGPATGAGVWGPACVAFDSPGNMYVTSGSQNRIRKVDTNGIISTVAGNGNQDYSGDGVAATNTSLYSPNGVVFDALGNFYIADSANERVRKVDINGIITTVAGNGSETFAGDGGAATNATVSYPFGVALDAPGNLYIADSVNNRIRKVNTNGIITTVVGNGSAAYAGDGGAATNAALNNPFGVGLDPLGNLYIADSGNNRIRKVDTNGIITTVAGDGNDHYSGDGVAATNTSLYSPNGVTFDAPGNLYIADSANNRIRKVNTNGIITTVAGNGSRTFAGDGGAATNASFNIPYGVAFDSVGNMYVADTGNNLIRKVHYAGDPTLSLTSINTNNAGNYNVVITGPFGSVTSSVAVLTVVSPPTILYQPASQRVVAGSNVTFSVTATGTQPLGYSWYLNATTILQSGSNSSLALPGVTPGNNGNYTVVVTNAYSSVTSQVAMLTVGFPPMVTISGSQTAFPGSNVVVGAVADGTGPINYQWLFNGTNIPNGIISTVAGNGTGKYAGDGGAAINASLYAPRDVCLDASGDLYIADAFNNRVRKVDTSGVITTVAGNGSQTFAGDGGAATNASLIAPYGVALDTLGDFYIADSQNGRIRMVSINGIINTVAGGGSGGNGGAATNASLFSPRAVTLDANGNLYIADTANNLVRKVDTNGVITTVAGGGSGGDGIEATNASLGYPSGVTLDANGDLYIGDFYGYRVRKVDTNGIITTVAGNGNYGYSGDGSAATNTSLSEPAGVAVDAFGDIYIADTGAYRVRKVDPNGFITTVAGNGTSGYAGDGGAATNAKLGSCYGMALDTSGNLFIADSSNSRIRKLLLYAGYPTLTLNSVNAYNAGGYSVIISSPYGSVTSSVSPLIVQAPPIITVQPASQTAVAGSSLMFSSTVVGSGPFEYSWFCGSSNLVQSGTNSSLMLTGISTNDAGNYTVIVTNSYGSVTSQVASLTVAIPPSVSISGNQSVFAGTTATFNVTASGTGPFFYQWQLNGTNLPKTIATVAGGGAGALGDGGQATNAFLNGPNAATADAFGNVLIADWGNNRVRKVTTNGVITTVAGNGSTGASANGSVATDTGIYNPAFVVADPVGDLFIVENGTSLIARVGTNGILRNVAGKGIGAFNGDGVPATNAYINSPFGIALDVVGNLFIADRANNRIRKVGTNGIITTFAGRSAAGFAGDGGQATNATLLGPWGIFIDSSGNLLISDTGNNRVREVGTNGIITTIAGNGTAGFSGDGGAATNASLSHPTAVAFDAIGNLLIADEYNNRIRQIDPSGIITTIAGGGSNWPGNGGPATSVSLAFPSSVAVDVNGNIIVDDNLHGLILKLFSGPNLPLAKVSANNAGNYTVVVTSPYGSVTSSIASLIVILPPQNFVASIGAGSGVQLQFKGTPNYPYTLQSTTNLTPPVVWQPVVTNAAGTNGNWVFIDTNGGFVPARFYRSLAQ